MSIDIVPFSADREEAVRSMNARLRTAGSPHWFPASHVPEWLPRQRSDRVYQELSVAVDDTSQVRGAYILKHQEFLLNGVVRTIADYHSPLSEAVIDRKYNAVGLRLLSDALRKQPRLFALGMGGRQHALPRMLEALRWSIAEVPFFFRVVHARRFLQNIVPLRSSASRRWILDILALTGLGWIGIRSAAVFRPARRCPGSIAFEQVADFGRWADELWETAGSQYALAAVRDSHVLNTLYAPGDERFIRLKISRDGRSIGWAVLLATKMSAHQHFSDMTVGTLADCFSDPSHAADVVACARDVLAARGVDLMISNQSHAAWCGALRSCGFLQGPSNFLFAASPELAAEFQPLEERLGTFHLNRGDGDGPIHL